MSFSKFSKVNAILLLGALVSFVLAIHIFSIRVNPPYPYPSGESLTIFLDSFFGLFQYAFHQIREVFLILFGDPFLKIRPIA